MELEDSNVDIQIEQRMLAITPDTGSFYNLVLKLMNANRILEIGTSVGYSTLWFAEALSREIRNSKIVTIEKSHDKVLQAALHFQEAGVTNLIEIREGIANRILLEMRSTTSFKDYFDFVFIDADKENAVDYFKHALSLTRIGGMIAADNLYEPVDCVEPMSRYSRYIRTRTDVQTTSVRVGKGQELTLRLV